MSLDSTQSSDHVESVGDHVDSKEILVGEIILVSGAAMLPHPDKALTCREDAYFISDNNWLGIADGVGQWSFEGINAGIYARELMENCKEIASDNRWTFRLYEKEIATTVSSLLEAGIGVKEIAELLATRAQEVGKSASERTPFADAAKEHGYAGYAGGKPDDVSVIVSLVKKESNTDHSIV